MSFDEILDLTADVLSFENNCLINHTRLLVYSRTNNALCLSLQQYPVDDSHNINNGVRAADGSGDTLGLQEKAPSRVMWCLVNITNEFHVATGNKSSPTRTHTL